MFLINISTQILSRGFLIPHKRIVFNYLVAMMAIFLLSGISLYIFIIESLDRQFDRELLTFAEAAAPSLSTLKNEGRQSLEREISWRRLFATQQYSLEWYDSQGRLLAEVGPDLTSAPLFKYTSPAELKSRIPVLHQQDGVQTATISVYADDTEDGELILEGYIRASESTEEMEAVIKHLRLGLEMGGATAIILSCISSVYLTTETLKPIRKGVQRLRRTTSDISHQVRTPLFRISIATDILLSQTSKAQIGQLKKLNAIDRAVEQIKQLLEELLFLVRTDTATNLNELRVNTVSASEIMQSLHEKFEPIAKAKGIELQTRRARNIWLKGDRDKLNRLLSDLLDNAIKYTESGGEVFFGIERLSNKVAIVVKDTGIGISQEHLPLVFQDFWRSDEAKIKDPNSFGLGLPIASAIARQHRGKITVESTRGVGSRFVVYLPLAKAPRSNSQSS